MNSAQFDHIFRTYHASLCAYATGIVQDAHIAEDLVEDVFLKLLQREEKPEILEWRAYLYLAVRNTCLNFLKRQSRIRPLDTIDTDAVSYEEESEILYIETFRRVMQAIDQLPDQCAKVIRMAYLENQSTKAIADKLGITESTVYNQKARGITLLKKMLPSAIVFSVLLH